MAEGDTETREPERKGGGTVHVPGLGPMKKKTALWVTFGGVGLVLGYIYLKQRGTIGGGSSTASTAATVTDPAGNVCATLDPTSGYCPGSAEDQAYYSTGGLGPATTGGFVDTSGALDNTSGGSSPIGPGSFSNNAEWAQYCESSMGSNGADAIAAALGKYITGGAVSATQVTTIDEAIAIGGYPPVQGPGGKPPSINQTGAPNPTQVTVPNVIGERLPEAHAKLKAAGLTYNTSQPTRKGYDTKITAQSPKGGAKANKGTHVNITWHWVKQ